MADLILLLEKQVSSLESSIILRELGVPQRSLFYWARCRSFMEYDISTIKEIGEWKCVESKISAFTVAEFGELLLEENIPIKWGASWVGVHLNETIEETRSSYEVEAREKTLIYLIKNKLMEVPK